MSLERFCRKPVAVAKPDEPVASVARAMREKHVGCVVVVDLQERPVGVVTDRDIVCRVVAEGRDIATTTVREAMSTNLVIAREYDLIDEATMRMRKAGVRRLPIVAADNRLIGIIALDDLIVLLSAELAQTATAVRANRGP